MKTNMKKTMLMVMLATAVTVGTIHAQNSSTPSSQYGSHHMQGTMANGGMMGQGMMNGGMMGRNMMGGQNSWGMGCNGMMGGAMMSQMSADQQQEFLSKTRDLRKQMMEKRFAYMEAMRNPDTTPRDLAGMEKEMLDLRAKMMDTMNNLQGK